jgi:hypothetical protein
MEDNLEIIDNIVYLTSDSEFDPNGEPLVVEYTLEEWQALIDED